MTRTRQTRVNRAEWERMQAPALPKGDHGTPSEVAEIRARRGALLLDAEIPGWADEIDLDRLDIGEGEMRGLPGTDDSAGCILCQVDYGITLGRLASPRCVTPKKSGGDHESDRLDELTWREQKHQAEMRVLADAAAEVRADISQRDRGYTPEGDYDRLAFQLGLATYGGLKDNDTGKVVHGFLADSRTTYAALDVAWRSEVLARRSDA